MDDELERIKQRRLDEMKRQFLIKKLKERKKEEPKSEKPKEPTNQDILDKYFGARAWEVYNAAIYQYPRVMPQVEKILVEGIKTGKIREIIDGAALMGFFRAVGIPIRLKTKIRISEKGELKTLEQKMKENQS